MVSALRSFPLRLALVAGAAAFFALPAGAQTGSGIVVGVAAPLSGPSAILGQQVTAGATEAVREASTEAAPVSLLEADTACTAEGGAAAARTFAAGRVAAAVGFLCVEALEAALPILTEAGIPVIDVGVRASRITDLRERTRFLVWRLAPRADAEAEALAAFVLRRWRDVPFGLVEDGSVYGRDLADAVRSRLEAEGLQPTLVDNYRPAEQKQFGIARRIGQSGVTRLLVFGTRSDVAILARDAAETGVTLEIVGVEALVDEPTPDVVLADGVVALAAGRDIAQDPTAAAAAPGGSPPVAEGYFDPAFSAVQIVVRAVRQSREESRAVADVLNSAEFPTRLGPIRFDAKGDAGREAFEAFEWRGDRFVVQAGG